MKIEVRELMDDNEMLSHVFLGCVPSDELIKIRDKYLNPTIDWRTESVKIPVDLKIGGVSVNPKAFFDNWKDQMQGIILREAKKLVSEKMGASRLRSIQSKLSEYEAILENWENDINWDVPNPFLNLNVTTTIYEPKVGDLVKPNKQSGYILASGSGTYDEAVVVSESPFILTSVDADMMWSSTIKKEYFDVIGTVNADILAHCKKRLIKD